MSSNDKVGYTPDLNIDETRTCKTMSIRIKLNGERFRTVCKKRYTFRVPGPVLGSALLLFILIIFQFLPAFADEPSKNWGKDVNEELLKPQGDNIPLVKETYSEKLDASQEEASKLIISAATWLDSFFGDSRYTLEENQTRGRLRLSFGYDDRNNFDFSVRFRLDLKVPNLSQKLNFYISADDEDFETDYNPAEPPDRTDSEREKITTGFRYFLKEAKKYNISTSIGLNFDYIYLGLRFRYLKDFGSWQGRFTDRLRWYTDRGWENKATMDLERYFSARWMFRTTAEVNWYEEEDGLPHSLSFNLYQAISKERAVMYEIINYFDTEPKHYLTDAQFRIRYRQRFYRDWLTLEVAPFISFPKEYDKELKTYVDHERKVNPGIIIQLEAEFGNLSDLDPSKTVFRF